MSIFTYTKYTREQLRQANERLRSQCDQSRFNGDINAGGDDPHLNPLDPANKNRPREPRLGNEKKHYRLKNH